MKIIIFILVLLVFQVNTGPITAYSACVSCCGTIHWYDWMIPSVGVFTTSLCITEACLNPFPCLCIDPRDNSCSALFISTMFLPSL